MGRNPSAARAESMASRVSRRQVIEESPPTGAHELG